MKLSWKPYYCDKDFEIISEHKNFENYIEVYSTKYRFKKFDGTWSNIVTRVRVDKQEASAVLIVNPDQGTVLLIEQARHCVIGSKVKSPWLLDTVAGVVENGDTPEETAFRESKEEAGVDLESIRFIGKYFASCGYSNEVTHVYCGITRQNLPDNEVHGLLEENEDIKTHVLGIDDAINLLNLENTVLPASITIALQWLALNKENII